MPESLDQVAREDVERRLDAALQNLLRRHSHLLDVNVNERSVTHHLAVCLEEGFPGWDVDVEYNRDIYEIKRLPPIREVPMDDIRAQTVFPDVIIHRRGTRENLLVIEVKKFGARELDFDFDRQKLTAFTSPEALAYRFAALVTLPGTPKQPPVVEWFCR